jgi:outer membrane lipoprotein-sorting protein
MMPRHPVLGPFSLMVLVAAFCLQGQPAQARQESTSDQQAAVIAQRLSDRYDGIESMRLRFVQTASSAFMDTDERYSGDLVFTDTSYRIETSNQTIVSNGITTWIHNRGQAQVIINDFVEDEGSFSLTTFLRSFSDEYRSSWEGTQTLDGALHDRLRLLPTDEFAAFRQVDLWIRQSDTLVTRLIAVDLNDVRMVFELSDIVVNPALPADQFQFEMPSNVDVVDLREDG